MGFVRLNFMAIADKDLIYLWNSHREALQKVPQRINKNISDYPQNLSKCGV